MIKNFIKPIENIQNILGEYIKKNGLKALVLGISGGIDSALCAALAAPVCQKLNIELICRSITISTNKIDEIERAEMIGKAFGTDFKEIDLSHLFDILQLAIAEDYKNADFSDMAFKIRGGNLKARIRMMYLYDLAASKKAMVLSTDNYTELLLGFWTLHGDVGDYGMIQNLWKTEVYAMSRYMASQYKEPEKTKALMDCVNAIATDGLGITSGDLEQIQAKSYEEVDQILIRMLKNPDDKSLKDNKVVQRKMNSEYKRSNPYNIPRNEITEEDYF